MTSFDDEFYRDILEGVAVHAESTFYRDVLGALTLHQAPQIGVAMNRNQMASKRWLADALFEALGSQLGSVLILGGWVGVLAAVLLHDRRFVIDRVVSLDVDPRCAPIARSMNATHVATGRFDARTADMLDIDYEAPLAAGGGRCDLVINTSCEHLRDFGRWFDRIPRGQRLVLQSNDYVACTEHVNCVPDLAAFRAQAPLADLRFAGERPMRRYVRFMLIGAR